MRIIAGKARSLPLKTIEGTDTRPTTDRIKETLFNMIQSELPGASFLDLFAGSGAIGLEAISRGAKRAVFVEKNKKAVSCIQENINFTKFNMQSTVLGMDVFAALRRMENEEPFDIVFMDPPYNQFLEKQVLNYLKDSAIITKETLLIAETALETDLSYVEELGYEILKVKNYKSNKHIFLQQRT